MTTQNIMSLRPQAIIVDNTNEGPVHSIPEDVTPFYPQLLKWVGNKQRYAHKLIAHFPKHYRVYYEPFLGSGSILSVVAPQNGIASDLSEPLIGVWKLLKEDPHCLIEEYEYRYHLFQNDEDYYYEIRDRYNKSQNAADLLFLSRTCYGGVMRFRKSDGFMSTPIGAHEPITPYEFQRRVTKWCERVKGTTFHSMDYSDAFLTVQKGDLVYCDPPYNGSQNILYGSHNFSFSRLLDHIHDAKYIGANVALSIDKFNEQLDIGDLFEQIIHISTGTKRLNHFHNKRNREERMELLLLTSRER